MLKFLFFIASNHVYNVQRDCMLESAIKFDHKFSIGQARKQAKKNSVV